MLIEVISMYQELLKLTKQLTQVYWTSTAPGPQIKDSGQINVSRQTSSICASFQTPNSQDSSRRSRYYKYLGMRVEGSNLKVRESESFLMVCLSFAYIERKRH